MKSTIAESCVHSSLTNSNESIHALAMEHFYVIEQVIANYQPFRLCQFNALADLVQEGYLALYKAAEKFDANRCKRFSSFAYTCVLNALRSYVYANEYAVCMPYDDDSEVPHSAHFVSFDSTPKAASRVADDRKRYYVMLRELIANSNLDERERTIVQNKYDFNLSTEPMSTEELAIKYKMTPQSINRLNRGALEKLHHASETA